MSKYRWKKHRKLRLQVRARVVLNSDTPIVQPVNGTGDHRPVEFPMYDPTEEIGSPLPVEITEHGNIRIEGGTTTISNTLMIDGMDVGGQIRQQQLQIEQLTRAILDYGIPYVQV